jgi:molybdopterin-containing oxidoreductase family iron-sulfur binding subunit
VAREFPLQAEQGPVSRRTFMQLMAASFAFAGLDACRWQEDKIAPLSRRPEGYLPGMERHYSSTLDRNGFASPMRVTSYDGRPIKIEGNPQHPFGGGASTALDQATILELYDPDRSRKVKQHGRDAS